MNANDKAARGRQYFVLTLLLLAFVYCVGGLWLRGRALAAWRQDYELAVLGKRHPFIARLVAGESAARAAERFAREYEGLQEANILTAPLRVVVALDAHNELAGALGGQERAAPVAAPGPRGVVVESVAPGSNAARAGLVVGDVILRYDGRDVASNADLQAARDGAGVLASPVVVVRRGSQTLSLTMAPGVLGVTCSER